MRHARGNDLPTKYTVGHRLRRDKNMDVTTKCVMPEAMTYYPEVSK